MLFSQRHPSAATYTLRICYKNDAGRRSPTSFPRIDRFIDDPLVVRINSPAGFLTFRRPLMAMYWQVPEHLLQSDKCRKLLASVYALSEGTLPTTQVINENCHFNHNFSFHRDGPSARYHLTRKGVGLHWVSGTRGNPSLQRNALASRPPLEHVHVFPEGALIRFNGGMVDDLIHSAPPLRPGDKRSFVVAGPMA